MHETARTHIFNPRCLSALSIGGRCAASVNNLTTGMRSRRGSKSSRRSLRRSKASDDDDDDDDGAPVGASVYDAVSVSVPSAAASNPAVTGLRPCACVVCLSGGRAVQ